MHRPGSQIVWILLQNVNHITKYLLPEKKLPSHFTISWESLFLLAKVWELISVPSTYMPSVLTIWCYTNESMGIRSTYNPIYGHPIYKIDQLIPFMAILSTNGKRGENRSHDQFGHFQHQKYRGIHPPTEKLHSK